MTAPEGSGKGDVCIIGAGPGGLSMARLLVQKGYKVTVLERRDRAGGMCRSIFHDGRWFDVGANYVTSDYKEVRALATEYGLKLTPDKAFQHQMSMDAETGAMKNAQKVINSGHSMVSFLIAALRYFWYQYKYRSIVHAPGYEGVSSRSELMMPFGQWLREHKMAPLQKLFMIPITAMCYGTLDEIPTPHALRYINATRFFSMLKTGMHIPQRWPKRFVNGFGNMWKRVALDYDVEYETEIISVERENGRVTVMSEHEGGQQTREFDHLVLGIPPSAALSFLDATPTEKALYSDTILFNHYAIATATVRNFPWFVVNEMQPHDNDQGRYPPRTGHPYIFGKQWKLSDLTLYYAPLDGDPDPVGVRAQMKTDSLLSCARTPTAEWGGWTCYADWPTYFPRVSIDDMTSFNGGPGWYDQVEAIQGENNTYVCHGVVAFELVETIMQYARHLANERF